MGVMEDGITFATMTFSIQELQGFFGLQQLLTCNSQRGFHPKTQEIFRVDFDGLINLLIEFYFV